MIHKTPEIELPKFPPQLIFLHTCGIIHDPTTVGFHLLSALGCSLHSQEECQIKLLDTIRQMQHAEQTQPSSLEQWILAKASSADDVWNIFPSFTLHQNESWSGSSERILMGKWLWNSGVSFSTGELWCPQKWKMQHPSLRRFASPKTCRHLKWLFYLLLKHPKECQIHSMSFL